MEPLAPDAIAKDRHPLCDGRGKPTRAAASTFVRQPRRVGDGEGRPLSVASRSWIDETDNPLPGRGCRIGPRLFRCSRHARATSGSVFILSLIQSHLLATPPNGTKSYAVRVWSELRKRVCSRSMIR